MKARTMLIGMGLAATAAGSCGGGGSSDENPPKLWLAPLNGEVDVQLSADEPPTY